MAKKEIITDKAPKTEPMVFEKVNYQLLIAAIGVIILGFVLMMMETGEYGIGFLGLTLGPLVALIGFALGFVAILYTPKKNGAN